MSLHGSLETFALPDVLSLLSTTRKSGELRVVGGRLDGRVWVEDGKAVASEVGRAQTLVDAVFELLRLVEGTFSFEAERRAPAPGTPMTIEPVLAEARARLLEWRQIETVVPSLEVIVRMAAEAPGAEVTLRADQWRMLMAAGEGRPVSALMDRLDMCEFDTCRAVKELVEARLAVVETEAGAEQAGEAPPVQDQQADEAPPAPPEPPADPFDGGGPGGGELRDLQRLTTLREDDDGAHDVDSLVEIPGRFRRHQATASVEGADESDRGSVATLLAAAREPAERLGEAVVSEASPETVATPADGSAGPGAPVAAAAEGSAHEGEEDGEEPINRGLLLKFLSSVRS